MRLSKELQYGLVFCLYLTIAGRARVDTAAANLNISRQFLQRIAHKLKKFGVLNSFKGPGGGFELVPETKMLYIFKALGSSNLISNEDSAKLVGNGPESRALVNFSLNMGGALQPLLNRQVGNVMKETVANEMAALHKIDAKGWEC